MIAVKIWLVVITIVCFVLACAFMLRALKHVRKAPRLQGLKAANEALYAEGDLYTSFCFTLIGDAFLIGLLVVQS